MKAISVGLRNELEAVAAAKGIDLSKADASSEHGSLVPPYTRYSTLQDLLDAGRQHRRWMSCSESPGTEWERDWGCPCLIMSILLI